ncbi:MAG: helix-turn-helix domain-containing protein, partial [Candidatus Omnitrophica bacterium]|nr:helix-turn-helix domain-containing protein [Candidatus Omnitrophota bacterium]
LARGMRQLNGVYTQHFNQAHRRVGHLLQGRYTAILVEKETHLLELCRYVVLNPIRARMVNDPAAWLWSSYRAMIGAATIPTWLTTDWVLSQFGSQRAIAQQRYRDFVMAGLTAASPWKCLRGQIYLGSEQFCQAIALNTPQEEVPRRQCQPVRPSLEVLFAEPAARPVLVLTAYRAYGYRLREIAEHLKVHYTTVSRWLRAAETTDDPSGHA